MWTHCGISTAPHEVLPNTDIYLLLHHVSIHP